MTNFRMTTIALLTLSTFMISACNTVEGIGRDLEKAGESVQKAAD